MNADASPPPRTKIVATLGPASSTPETIRALIERGMNFARLNASHADRSSHARLIALVRAAAAELGRSVGILYDLQGPKIRIGHFDGPARPVRKGDCFALVVGAPAGPDEFPADYAALDGDVRPGERLLIDDGTLATVVVEVERGRVRCRALNDGEIAPRKGINLPESRISAPALTEKDHADVEFAVEHAVDAIALSFVRGSEDVHALRKLLRRSKSEIPIISKIEKPQALDNLEEILQASWGAMVARGDLGVELSPPEVPMAQKRIIHTAISMHRPVITATQMLDSMTRNPRPTRAEASDVANAVLDGTDAVMLSAETAIGRYPEESVAMMQQIIETTDRYHVMAPQVRRRRRERGIDSTPEAVADAACEVGRHLQAKALVAFTQSGMTAILTAARRPETPIIAFTNRPAVRNLLTLVWSVRPYLLRDVDNTDQLIQELDATLLRNDLASRGDRLVVLMGVPTSRMGPTNLMLLYDVGGYWPREDDE